MLFVEYSGTFGGRGVAVLAASCKSVVKFSHSFSISAGSLSLVVKFVLSSISFLKRSQFVLEL
jgi:hypothetical protein